MVPPLGTIAVREYLMLPEHSRSFLMPDIDSWYISCSHYKKWNHRPVRKFILKPKKVSLRFGSGQLTHPPPPNLCIINTRIFCFPTLHTHFLLQHKTSLCCWNIWLELCLWVLTFFTDEKFTLIEGSLCWKPKLVKDHLTDHSPNILYSIIHNLHFPTEQPQSTVKPLQRSENWCLVDYDYSCMIPGQNMPSCKSFLCIERAQ